MKLGHAIVLVVIVLASVVVGYEIGIDACKPRQAKVTHPITVTTSVSDDYIVTNRGYVPDGVYAVLYVAEKNGEWMREGDSEYAAFCININKPYDYRIVESDESFSLAKFVSVKRGIPTMVRKPPVLGKMRTITEKKYI